MNRHDHRHWRMSWLGWYVRARLHRRLFMWFGFSIILTGLAVGLSMHLASVRGVGWPREQERLQTFVGHRFAEVWNDPERRGELASSTATDLDLDLTLVDHPSGTATTFGQATCAKPSVTVPVLFGSMDVGEVRVCATRHSATPRWILFGPLLLLLFLLWGGSGRIALRIARPLSELARVATDVGAGKLSSRATVDWRNSGEVAVLAEVFNEMASRIERQIADQRELLAGVSHELRTPLARIRLLIELLRDGIDLKRLDDIEREVVEIDALVGELLASSRLDFAAINARPLDGATVARDAVERAGLRPELLSASGDLPFEGDPTLIARALANLLENARRHGNGVTGVLVEHRGEMIAFEVDDTGPGIPGDPEAIFKPFAPRQDGKARENGSLGLGLTLVRRIAQAHGGRAYAANRPGGGAKIGFEVLIHRPVDDAA